MPNPSQIYLLNSPRNDDIQFEIFITYYIVLNLKHLKAWILEKDKLAVPPTRTNTFEQMKEAHTVRDGLRVVGFRFFLPKFKSASFLNSQDMRKEPNKLNVRSCCVVT